MSQGWRWMTAGLLCVQAAGLAGCGSTQTAAMPVQRESLAADLAREESPRLARLQQPETPPLKVPAINVPPMPLAPLTQAENPALAPLPTTGVPELPSGAKQISLTGPRPNKIMVRAWVNGKPVFDDEVMQNIPRSAFQQLAKMSEAQRAEKITELFNQTLDQLVEQEVIYQEAIRKLEKNRTTLDKLKTLAEEDFEKQLRKIRQSGVPEDQIKEFQRQMRRSMERSFIAMEYMRSRIFPLINQGIGFQEIKDYYDAHPNEFQKIESLKWQDVFLAVGPQRPTLADARRDAEDLIAQCRTGADFIKLVQYDDGASKFNGGEGLGSRRGEIRPAELEEHLFKLRDGEIGPVVELTTGVHIIRLVSRAPGGQLPLNEAVQNQIRSKLRNQLADREYKRIVRELRGRSVIEVVASAD